MTGKLILTTNRYKKWKADLLDFNIKINADVFRDIDS